MIAGEMRLGVASLFAFRGLKVLPAGPATDPNRSAAPGADANATIRRDQRDGPPHGGGPHLPLAPHQPPLLATTREAGSLDR